MKPTSTKSHAEEGNSHFPGCECQNGDGHEQYDHEDDYSHEHSAEAVEYVRLGLLAMVIISSLTGWWKHFMSHDWLALAATVVGGWPIFEEAWENLRKRRMTMELSMTIALIAALCIGQFFTALVIAFFVLFAELLEGYTVGEGRRAIEKLIESLPRQVTVRRAGEEQQVAVSDVSLGETIIIRPGERVPADGTVVKGHSFVDQASITGESLPVEKAEGTKVFAGTINKEGVLQVSVEKIGRDTTFGKIIGIVEQAEKSKAPVQRIADRFAAALVYFAFGAATLTFIVTRNVTSTIAVIIVAGACGVAAGTPLAILAGIGNAARRGIVIKGGIYLELLNGIDTIVLDKTGTLTLGVPRITNITPLNGADEDGVLQMAAIAEQHSEHPLGEAIVQKARERGLPLREYKSIHYMPGKGVHCSGGDGSEILVGTRGLLEEYGLEIPKEVEQVLVTKDRPGHTAVLVGRNRNVLGGIVLADELRTEAKETIAALNRHGYRTILLTGDAPETAQAAGQELGVNESIGGLLPEQKVDKIRELLRAGRKVAMVGDGVNDAPALAEATVGIAMGQGTDVALEIADVTLMTSDLSRLLEVLGISKRCYRVIMFNFCGTIVVDTIGIAFAFFGMLAPIIAALIHVGSELAFIMNSARLFRQQAAHKSPAV
ncbi:MAG: cation-translocating P-type ATPase [Candidatus Udaeobacter sp.]